MAWSSNFTFRESTAGLPDSYTNPTVAELGSGKHEARFSTTIAASGVANADPAVAAANLGGAVKTWVDGTLIADAVGGMAIDTTNTVTGRIVITSVQRQNDREDLSDPDWVTGTDEFNVEGILQWERT